MKGHEIIPIYPDYDEILVTVSLGRILSHVHSLMDGLKHMHCLQYHEYTSYPHRISRVIIHTVYLTVWMSLDNETYFI